MNLNKFVPKIIQDSKYFNENKDDLGMALCITSIPLFFAIPYLIFLFIFSIFKTEHTLHDVYFIFIVLWIIFKITLFFFLIGLTATQRARQTLSDSTKNPLIIIGGFFISTFFIIYNKYNMLTYGDAKSFKDALPYAVIIWLLFWMIQSKWFIKLIPKWLLWIIRIPIWLVILIYSLVFIEIWGNALFLNLF